MKVDLSPVYAPFDLKPGRDEGAVAAIKAMAKGEARPDQQQLALDYIVHTLARIYLTSYRPDAAGGDRDTAFAEGRRFVGNQIRWIILTPTEILFGREPQAREHE